MKHTARLLLSLMILRASTADAVAADQSTPTDLARASLEALMNIEITSAERKQQRADDVPAAVYVITHDDIERSGLSTVPELLRLVPGVQVARISGSRWAVSVRGFNQLFSNKLLVLIDGRSIYNRAFSGVFWDFEDPAVQDIDRIEVIRGAGGTTWGANAVNGVINIITRSAADTQGPALHVAAGTFDATQSIRYGGRAGALAYRLYSQWTDHRDTTKAADRTSAGDGWHVWTTGARIDWTRGADAFVAEGSFSSDLTHPLWTAPASPRLGDPLPLGGTSTAQSGHALGRWTRSRGAGSDVQVQSFAATHRRDDVKIGDRETVVDLDVQYHAKVGARHDIVSGGGVRAVDYTSTATFAIDLGTSDNVVINAFAQDEIALGSRLSLTVGSRLEHDTTAGWGLLPSARMSWNHGDQHAWGAISQARRTPSILDRSARINVAVVPGDRGLPVVIQVIGDPAHQSERLLDVEGGYRRQVGGSAAVDIAAFRGSYSRLNTLEPVAPFFEARPAPAHVVVATQFENLLDADTTGLEIAGHWMPASAWRIDGSYSAFELAPHPHPATKDPTAAAFDGNTPAHQWQLHMSTWIGRRLQLDGGTYFVGRLRQLNVPAYVRADARIQVKLTDRLSAMLVGQNLLDPAHQEFASATTGMLTTLVPRSVRVQARWQR